jgi:NDP-hexose 4-ketoreductase
MATRLAVVGGRGWLGRAIVQEALAAGMAARTVSRAPGPGTVLADPADPGSLARALAACDVVVNAGGCRADTPEALRAANVDLPDRLAGLSVDRGFRLVHLGSAAEYGPGVAGPERVGEDSPCFPTSRYGTTKLLGCEAVLGWRARGAAAVVARVFNVADAELPDGSPLQDIVDQLRPVAGPDGNGCGTVAIGDPTTVRDISTRAWVAEAVVALAAAPITAGGPGVVNVCSGRPTAFGELAGSVARRLGATVAVVDRGWPRAGHIVGDPTRLHALAPHLRADTPRHLVEALADAAAPARSRGDRTCASHMPSDTVLPAGVEPEPSWSRR